MNAMNPSPNTYLLETSATLDYFKPMMNGPEKSTRAVLSLKPLIIHLHKNTRLPHDLAKYTKLDNDFKFSDLKNMIDNRGHREYWIILLGQAGAACIMYDPGTGNWKSYISTLDEGVIRITNSRITDIVRETKDVIGKIVARYQGEGPRSKIRIKKNSNTGKSIDIDDIYQRFSPFIDNTINQAIADIRGMIITQIKNDAFEKAEKRLAKLKKLYSVLDMVDPERKNVIKPYLNAALAITASMYYPEMTGNIPTARPLASQIRPANDGGMYEVLNDINKGDMKKLGTILYYLRREMIAA